MTVNTLTIELTCNGKTLKMGPGQDIDITAVSGLESSEVEISTSDNALVDGASVYGKKIKLRVKPETQSDTKVRVRGQGYDRGDGTYGDLIITYKVKLPTNLNDKQKNLLHQMQMAQ